MRVGHVVLDVEMQLRRRVQERRAGAAHAQAAAAARAPQRHAQQPHRAHVQQRAPACARNAPRLSATLTLKPFSTPIKTYIDCTVLLNYNVRFSNGKKFYF